MGKCYSFIKKMGRQWNPIQFINADLTNLHASIYNSYMSGIQNIMHHTVTDNIFFMPSQERFFRKKVNKTLANTGTTKIATVTPEVMISPLVPSINLIKAISG